MKLDSRSVPALVLFSATLLAACSDSSGPGDRSITLILNLVPSPTNDLRPVISGTTDPGASITVVSPADSLSDLASAVGEFSLSIDLRSDAVNEVIVLAEDSAGNALGDTLVIAHDSRAPTVTFVSPLPGDTTAGQSGFAIELEFADQVSGVDFASGVDPTSFAIRSDQTVGGVFRSDGTTSIVLPPGNDLTPLFTFMDQDSARVLVADSSAFSPGTHRLTASVRDLADNLSSTRVLAFAVRADPDHLIPVDAAGGAGSSGTSLIVGLANQAPASGLQFDFSYPTAVIASVDSVTLLDRASSFNGVDFEEVATGRVRVLLFDVSGQTLSPGQGAVVSLWLSVDAAAPAGDHQVALEDILLSDPTGDTSPLPPAAGSFRVP